LKRAKYVKSIGRRIEGEIKRRAENFGRDAQARNFSKRAVYRVGTPL
jgi:hypothetical protein